MTDAMASTRGQIRALLKARSKAVEAKDIDLLMSFYRHDVVYFDLVPPLQYVGSEALRGRFLDWFARFRGPIRQEIGDLHLSAGDGFAAAYMLIRAGGTWREGVTSIIGSAPRRAASDRTANG